MTPEERAVIDAARAVTAKQTPTGLTPLFDHLITTVEALDAAPHEPDPRDAVIEAARAVVRNPAFPVDVLGRAVRVLDRAEATHNRDYGVCPFDGSSACTSECGETVCAKKDCERTPATKHVCGWRCPLPCPESTTAREHKSHYGASVDTEDGTVLPSSLHHNDGGE